MSFELEGIEAFQQRLEGTKAAYASAAAAALYQEGFGVQALAQEKCPVEFGRLRATAYTAPPEINGDEISVTVGFGTDYGVYVHERTELHHNVGEAKFLERAFDDRSSGYLDRLGTRIELLAASGVGVMPLTSTPPREEG